jgi:hypothetical protein
MDAQTITTRRCIARELKVVTPAPLVDYLVTNG